LGRIAEKEMSDAWSKLLVVVGGRGRRRTPLDGNADVLHVGWLAGTIG
jgi:hypothetical protein